MNKPFLKTTLAFAVFTAMTVSVQAQDQVTEEKEGVVQSETTKLQTIVVTASGQAVDVKSAPASISVITAEEIQKQPVSSLADILKRVPGVTGGLSSNADGSKIQLRGMPENYTLILIDGNRVGSSRDINYSADLGLQDLKWVRPEMIERIEVVRGPMSSLYGSDAMGGVINIITKKIPSESGGSFTL